MTPAPPISGFLTEVVLWMWAMVVLFHGLGRSYARPAPDPVRPAGPV